MGGTSAGDPNVLTTAGTSMRDLANVLSRLGAAPEVSAGGGTEADLLKDTTDTGDFSAAFVKAAQELVTRVYQASFACADGAMALWYAAGDFKNADSSTGLRESEPSHIHELGKPYVTEGADHVRFIEKDDDGLTDDPDAPTYIEDRNHHWIGGEPGADIDPKTGDAPDDPTGFKWRSYNQKFRVHRPKKGVIPGEPGPSKGGS